ncbi:hypothetical protein [Spirosoma arcticum]
MAFYNPGIPYTIEFLGGTTGGYYFIFKEAYFDEFYRSGVKSLPLLAHGHKPVYSLDLRQEVVIGNLFGRM